MISPHRRKSKNSGKTAKKKEVKDGGKKNKDLNGKTENVMMKNLVGQHRIEGDAFQRILRHKPHRQHAPTRLVHQLPLLIATDTENWHAVHLSIIGDPSGHLTNMKQDVKHMYYDSKMHHVQSLARGFKAFGKGMETGLTGVFVDPVRSAQREGAKGFFKCIGQGLPGTVVKPVVGTDDLATKTIDEVKYATTVFDQKRRGRVSALAELAGVFLCSLRCWHRCSISFNWPRRV
ncbi:hypothetical protein BLNAU_24372 [Blattamonas nauphoetae]|uniref:Uncharacterized protein n=1 Tax=Blattamonas nauphoetae TaxID=2049346 RepID=A0ABQ9WMN1_9EUKA|nr:hypothetical protein BLNAU_24372 [Blattamonas nauphoetae]